MASRLHTSYPWVTKPFIANAPMSGVVPIASPALATQVSLNGGLGFIGGSLTSSKVDDQLSEATGLLHGVQINGEEGILPIGIGFLLFLHKVEDIVPSIEKHRPAAIWLFSAKELDDYVSWTSALRKASPQSAIWIQVGNVADAVYVATRATPDVVVVQGVDAGGHGLRKGAGVISLVPEVADAFAQLGKDAPMLVASGGIADGRAVAAVLALGAEGAVLGTRFLGSEEVSLPMGYQKAILNATDGGQTTVRDEVFDMLRGPNPWPVAYDGRSIISKSYTDFKSGKDIEDVRKEHQKATEMPDGGFGTVPGDGRAAVWAGTGVGLVRKLQKASEILDEVRRDTQAAKNMLLSKLS